MSTKIIYQLFAGKLIGPQLMKKFICEVVASLSDDLINQITTTCWFVSSLDDAWGFTITGNDLKNQHLIFLSEDLFRENDSQIKFSIAHEIGHVVLGHRNSFFEQQTQSEIKRQEREADEFARELL